ncbi:MAG: hypothetical protein AAF723_05325 [Pseudomonadota bacterium]
MSVSTQHGDGQPWSIEDEEDLIKQRQALLKRIAPALVSLDSFCRAHGLEDIASILDDALVMIDRDLTDRDI